MIPVDAVQEMFEYNLSHPFNSLVTTHAAALYNMESGLFRCVQPTTLAAVHPLSRLRWCSGITHALTKGMLEVEN